MKLKVIWSKTPSVKGIDITELNDGKMARVTAVKAGDRGEELLGMMALLKVGDIIHRVGEALTIVGKPFDVDLAEFFAGESVLRKKVFVEPVMVNDSGEIESEAIMTPLNDMVDGQIAQIIEWPGHEHTHGRVVQRMDDFLISVGADAGRRWTSIFDSDGTADIKVRLLGEGDSLVIEDRSPTKV